MSVPRDRRNAPEKQGAPLAYSLMVYRSMAWLDRLRQDLRYAARSLRRTPTLSLAAIITLALGIGAVTTVFSLYEAVLLRTLPVASPERLYFVVHGAAGSFSTSSHYPWYEEIAKRTDVFSGVAAYNVRDFKVSTGEHTERVTGQYVSGSYHQLVGAPVQLGRGFASEDDRTLTPIAVISDAYWTRRFRRDPSVVGKTLTVGGHSLTILGVTAPGFDGMQPGVSVDVTLPLSVLFQDDPEFPYRTDTWTSMPIVGRLKADVDPAAARTVIASVYREYMSRPENQKFSRTAGQLRTGDLQPAARGSDRLRRTYETTLQVLMAMVAAVLLIVCVNVANLLLMKAPARAREVAIRMSIGASRGRIVLQLITESMLLAICGGAGGILLASWCTEFVSALLRTGMRPIVIDLQPHATVLLGAFVVTFVAGVTFGVAPAVKATGIDFVRTLKAEGHRWTIGRWQIGQRALVAVQVALSLVLVFGAGLLARTQRNLQTVDGGFRKEGVIVSELDAHDTQFPIERLEALCYELVDRLKARPGVLSGSCSSMSPVATNMEGRPVTVPGMSPAAGAPPSIFANSVDPAYFETLGIDVRRGEVFTSRDTAGSRRVAVLSEAMARHYFGDTDPIGRTFYFGRSATAWPITIVGVVGDVRQELRIAAPLMVYTPLSQRDEPTSQLIAAIRSSGDTDAAAADIRDEVRGLTRDVALTYVRTMDEQIGASLVGERLLATLSGAFAVLAMVLACVGLYGVMSYEVARRSRDIGIRLALGARSEQILRQVLLQVVTVTAAGIVAGAAGAIIAARTLATLLYGLTADDAGTLLSAITALGLTALLAGYLPARRAASVDPAITLRAE